MESFRHPQHVVATLLIVSIVFSVNSPVLAVKHEKPRIIATTDGEIDDRCSMVRFLLYANEWDIEGIIYIILDQDKTFRDYIQPNWPDIMVLGSFRQFATVAYSWRNIIPKELHRFYDGTWMKGNILQSHGPLCARYESHSDGRFRSEGDSPAFMHQILVGLGSLDDPTYGGWGGRFVREEGTKNVWRGAQDDGSWSKPIWRWSEAFQNDWAARADWCVKPFSQANHNPRAVVNGVAGKSIVRIQAEPGTFTDAVRIDNPQYEQGRLTIPYDSQKNQFHIILTVRDNGSPNLFTYRRVIIESSKTVDGTPPSKPREARATAQGETQTEVTWLRAMDNETGIRRYVIYRDGNRVGESTSTEFVDKDLRENTSYAYQIAALNGCLVEGAKSSSVSTVTHPDETRPTIENVIGSGKKIHVVFSEPVERASAENVGHYAIDGGISIKAARLSDNQQSVVLTPSTMD